MITEIRIESIEKILGLIEEQYYEEQINRYRSEFLYRGLSNAAYELKTSLERNCKDKAYALETPILRNFSKYAEEGSGIRQASVWHQLAIGQHYGLPTRLLDWTYSPLMALHFATADNNLDNLDQHDACVWKISIIEQNKLLPPAYRKRLQETRAYLLTIPMLTELAQSLQEYDVQMDGKAFALLEPPSIDQRIINQYSYFSIIPKGMESIEGFLDTCPKVYKYIIPKELKWRIRDMLDQLNMSERITYPGLEGLSKWLKRHYYVK